MRKFLIISILLIMVLSVYGQQNSTIVPKYALVIGNANYTGISKLTNPVNDANDMAAALQSLGFTVDKILNGSLEQMESSIERLKNRLSVDKNAYGFFFYAGHGVQAGNGGNFLIPVDANITSETQLRVRAVSVQTMLDDLNTAGNSLNVIILDACRDNPFGWSRSTSRGLSIVSNQPADSIIVYATSAGSVASDGSGRNGLFTSHLLNHMKTPEVEVTEVFRRTMGDVARASNNQQRPAVYNQFYGTAFLGGAPAGQPEQYSAAQPAPMPLQPGRSEQLPKKPKEPREPRERPSEAAAKLWTIGASIGSGFADPLLIASLHGTLAPFRNSFFEIGADIGFVSKFEGVEKFYSIQPFAHYSYYLPFTEKMGFYAGAGGGCMIATYNIPQKRLGDILLIIPAADIVFGFMFFNALNVSYTIRSDFKDLGSKFSVGYVYRFK